MKNWSIISGITFVVFLAEALIDYHYGVCKSRNEPFSLKSFQFPNGKVLAELSAITIVASAISGSLIDYAEKKLG